MIDHSFIQHTNRNKTSTFSPATFGLYRSNCAVKKVLYMIYDPHENVQHDHQTKSSKQFHADQII